VILFVVLARRLQDLTESLQKCVRAVETKLHEYRLRKQKIFINSPIEPRKHTLYALLEQLVSVTLSDGKHTELNLQKRAAHTTSIPTLAVYRAMDQRDHTSIYAVMIGGLTALWSSLPALVKAYLLLATARGLISVAAGLLARRSVREIARDNLAHLIALSAILFIWFSGEMLHSEMSDLAQVLVLASKLISMWYAAQSVLEILDDFERLGIPIPQSLRDRLKQLLRGNNSKQSKEESENGNRGG
jgi:phage-related holin